VRGAATIGAGANLCDCYIGPYTAIGEAREIRNAEFEHSILLAGSTVNDLDGRIESLLLGRHVKIGRDARQPRAYRVLVGDNSRSEPLRPRAVTEQPLIPGRFSTPPAAWRRGPRPWYCG
jgi:NDP-sugar pyrophosphorylase family protein